jgi:cell division protein FtsI (penicillin-binding protein 3)
MMAGRLVQLRLTDATAVAESGLQSRLSTVTLFAPRGSIYDRNRNVLAQSVQSRYVFADPSRVTNAEQAAQKLRDLLGIPISTLMPLLTRKTRADGSKDEFEYLARGVPIATGDQVTALRLPGIGVGQDETRQEPGHDLAANLLGYVGLDGTGLVGLEAGYDKLLAGADGKETFEVGNGNLDTAIPGGYDRRVAPHPGTSLELTIDQDLQYKVQQILAARMGAKHADWAAAVVLDARTGEVLAQAGYPGYDAQNPPLVATQQIDPASQTVVDPGSIHKLITLSAALQTGVISPNSTVTLPGGSVVRGGATFRDDTPMRPGTKITIPGILGYSSNVGAITVASMMSPSTLYDYQRLFGLGSPTGEGMPGEAPGLVQPPQNWSGSSYGSIPIGMGVSVTPLQMAAAYAAIANDGVYIQPHLIKATITPDGTTHPSAAPATHRVVSAQVAAVMRRDLIAVTTLQGATGRSAAVPGYLVAGKTGTGQQVSNGTYLPGEVASFIGMSPVTGSGVAGDPNDSPRLVIAVFAHTPNGTGGAVAGPAFREMMEFALAHYQVPPNGAKAPKFRLTG